MKQISTQLSLLVSRIDGRTVQFVLLLVTLSLLVIGAGAPAGGSGGLPGTGG